MWKYDVSYLSQGRIKKAASGCMSDCTGRNKGAIA